MATEEVTGILPHSKQGNDYGTTSSSIVRHSDEVLDSDNNLLLNKYKEPVEMKILEAPLKFIVIIGFYLMTLKVLDIQCYLPNKLGGWKTKLLCTTMKVILFVLQIMLVLLFIADVLYVKTGMMYMQMVNTNYSIHIQKELLQIKKYKDCFITDIKLIPFTTMQSYLLTINYSIAVLFSFLFLVVYSWRATHEYTPIGIISETSKKRGEVITMIKTQLVGHSLVCLNFDHYRNKRYINVFWFIIQILIILFSIVGIALWIYRNLACGGNILRDWEISSDVDKIAHITLQLFNIAQWHIAPVAVSLLIRLVCIRLKAEMRKSLTDSLGRLMYRVNINNNHDIWRDFCILQKTISCRANKFTLITMLLVLFSITGAFQIGLISLSSSSEQLNAIWEHNWTDITQIYLFYYIYLASTWIMVDGMASLNEQLKSYTDELQIFLAQNNAKIEISDQIFKDISLIVTSYKGFQMSIFGPPFVTVFKFFYPIVMLMMTGFFISGNLLYGGYHHT